MVNFKPQSLKEASKQQPHGGLGNMLPSFEYLLSYYSNIELAICSGIFFPPSKHGPLEMVARH